MTLRVCIATAGTGSRLGELTRYVNKSLVSIANRPTLSHLIEQFPADAEFVLALGHKGNLVREFIALAYPLRKFILVDVEPFEGPGSGLGLSLLACKKELQQPFVFISCDTLVEEPILPADHDWVGYADVNDPRPYRTLSIVDGVVEDIIEKGAPGESVHAYIGLAGIHDHAAFWHSMETGGREAIESGEAYGLRALLDRPIRARRFTWRDTGNPEALAHAREAYREPGEPTILEKGNEAIWFVGEQVIKFSDDLHFIANRVRRVEHLEGFVPQVTASQPHMYRYHKAPGRVLSEAITLPLFERLLDHCEAFWETAALSEPQQLSFRSSCMRFYRDKTLERIALFYKTFGREDGIEPINGVDSPTLASLLERIDWDWLSEGLAGRFHGDFHFENILWDAAQERFVFLDWRQDFAGSLHVGDVYYDLAKLLHGLIVNHGVIARDLYQVTWDEKSIRFDLHRLQMLVDCENAFNTWLVRRGYDSRKVRCLTALIYLNIAALHHYPYSLLLYSLGKSMLVTESRRHRDD